MEIRIQGTQLDLTPSLKEYTQSKLEGVARLVDSIDADGGVILDVEIERTTHHHRKGDVYRAEMNLKVPGKLLRAEETAEDVHQAIVEVINELEREVKKYKGKYRDEQIKEARKLKEDNLL